MAYSENQFLAPLVREIGWWHNIIIFEKCKDDLQREFYLQMTKKYGWTKDNTVVEYALKSTGQPIGIATYTITKTLPPKYAGLLPTVEEIQCQFKDLSG